MSNPFKVFGSVDSKQARETFENIMGEYSALKIDRDQCRELVVVLFGGDRDDPRIDHAMQICELCKQHTDPVTGDWRE